MKANEIIRQHITEEYPQEVVEELRESADAVGTGPMSEDELFESMGIADEGDE